MMFDFSKFNWNAIADKSDTLFASFSRPYIAIICGTAIAGSCFNQLTAPIAIPVAGAVVAGYMAARSVDKSVAEKANTANKQIDADVQKVTVTANATQ